MQVIITKYRFQVIILIYLTAFNNVCFCKNRTVNQLLSYLFDDYSSGVRPVYNHSTITNVTYRQIFQTLLSMDTREQTFTVGVSLKATWLDEFLTWNPDDFNGLKRLHVPVTNIWTPDIILLITNTDLNFESYKPNTRAQLHPDGTIIWYVPVIYSSLCDIRVTWFPFDVQVCDMAFGSWAYNGFEIDLYPENSTDANTIRFLANGVWDIVDIRVHRELHRPLCCPETFPELHYRLIFKRHAEFYIYYMVLPCFFLSILSLLVFYLPPDCGEKLTLSITNLLALVVFQQIIAQNIPPSSDDSPVIGTYFLSMISMVCLSVIATVLVMHLSAISQPVPRWVKRVFLQIIPQMLCLSQDQMEDQMQASTSDKSPDSSGIEVNTQKHNVNGNTPNPASSFDSQELRDIAAILSYMKIDMEAKNTEGLERMQWRRVSIIIDRLLLCIFGLFTLVCTLLVAIRMAIGSEDELYEVLHNIDSDDHL